MLDLLSTFSIVEILIFIVLLAIAFKKVSDFIDWAHGKFAAKFKKDQTKNKEKEEINARLDNLETSVSKITDSVDKMTDKIDLLVASDKDDIKGYITREHHFFCYRQKWIDDYSLDCLERRFEHYIEENGNSFIETLMNEIRSLPKQDPNNGNGESKN